MELDYPNERLSLYRASHCAPGDGSSFLPWHAPHDAVPLKISARNMVSLPVILDGLLGLDFLHSRKVWISYATRQLLVERSR